MFDERCLAAASIGARTGKREAMKAPPRAISDATLISRRTLSTSASSAESIDVTKAIGRTETPWRATALDL
jgi:hypothetical protein